MHATEEYKEIRIRIIKEVFRDVTSQWDQNFVIFPLSTLEEI
jgi:2,4-dienoyl-CoA reductase-like NADH-dependent reductase (Old Yellow Enzyme family)